MVKTVFIPQDFKLSLNEVKEKNTLMKNSNSVFSSNGTKMYFS